MPSKLQKKLNFSSLTNTLLIMSIIVILFSRAFITEVNSIDHNKGLNGLGDGILVLGILVVLGLANLTVFGLYLAKVLSKEEKINFIPVLLFIGWMAATTAAKLAI